MNIVELLNLNPPYAVNKISNFLLSAPMLEYGIDETKTKVYASYQTPDGLISCIFYKDTKHKTYRDSIKNILGMNEKSDIAAVKELVISSKAYQIGNVGSDIIWPEAEDDNDVKIKVNIGLSPEVEIVSRAVVESLLDNDPNAVRNPQKVKEIKEQVAIADTLPPNVEIIGAVSFDCSVTDDYITQNQKYSNWIVKAVKYRKNKIALLGSPDPGWYKFKLLSDITIPSTTTEIIESHVSELLSSAYVNLQVPVTSTPPHVMTTLFLSLRRPKETNLIANLVKLFVQVHLKDKPCLAIIPFTKHVLYRLCAYGGWLIVSRFKNNKLLVLRLEHIGSRRSLNACISGVPITDKLIEFLKKPDLEIKIQDPSITKEDLIREIELMNTLNNV